MSFNRKLGQSQSQSQNQSFDLLYQDDALLVLNKPSGLLSVPGRGEDKQDCLSARVQAQFTDALVVHRLDMATSGLLLMARGLGAQRSLNAAFENRQIEKRYAACVAGLLPIDSQWQTIDLPILVDWPNRPLRTIHLEGQPSVTRWRCIANEIHAEKQTSRLELEPLTGRSHQLRVHLQALGHPIAGDSLYAPTEVQALATRLLLHASSLSFPHPLSGETLTLHCPADF